MKHIEKPANSTKKNVGIIYERIDPKIQKKAYSAASAYAKEMFGNKNFDERTLLERTFEAVSGRSMEEIRKLSSDELDQDPFMNDCFEASQQALEPSLFRHKKHNDDQIVGSTLAEYTRPKEIYKEGYLNRFLNFVNHYKVLFAGALTIGTITTIGTGIGIRSGIFNHSNPSPTPSHAPTYTPTPTLDPNADSNHNGIPDGIESQHEGGHLITNAHYNAELASMTQHQRDALMQRNESLTIGDWDRDGKTNISETTATAVFDPTNSLQTIKDSTVDYVGLAVTYNDVHNPSKTLPQVYGESALKKAVDFVEAYPMTDLTPYGADALPQFLADKDIIAINANPDYQLFTHAAVKDIQVYFYDAKHNVYWGKWEGPKTGMMLNEKFDPEEKAIMNQRWDDRYFILADGNRVLKNIESRILDKPWFYLSMDTWKDSPLYNAENTDTWITVAKANTDACLKVRAEVLPNLDDPKLIEGAIGNTIGKGDQVRNL